MAKHLDQIKEMLFEEPDFDEDSSEEEEVERPTTKSQVETIVFRDPAKRRKMVKDPPDLKSTTTMTKDEEFDLDKARFDVYKFGIKGFEKSKYEDARVALAVSLGAKPPKRKFINYKELIEENRAKKAKEKEEEENARLLGDLFQKNPNSKSQRGKTSKQKRIGRGDVGAMRFSSVGQFRGGVLKIREKDISRVKRKSRGKK